MDDQSPTRIHWWTRVKTKAFAGLESLINSGNDYHASVAKVLSSDKPQTASNDANYQQDTRSARYLWVYTATIGELNAISVLIDALLQKYHYASLLVVTDHEHYRDAIERRYPTCIVVLHGQSATGIDRIIEQYPPALLMIAEIPVTMFDAPCRLSFKVLFSCRAVGALTLVINGWLYHEKPSCRIDSIEQSWFHKDYLNLIDHFFMQTAYGRQIILQQGIDDKRITVTGNLKFDALATASQIDQQDSTNDLRRALKVEARPTIVCGCVTNISEQELIISAFRQIKQTNLDVLLILAPRHPENKARMEQLEAILERNDLQYQFRSSSNSAISENTHVLVLDTLGELNRFYALGDVCYVGLNHNILEPLNFKKTVVVTPGWDPKYPSYPVYIKLLEHKAIVQCQAEIQDVATTLSSCLNKSEVANCASCLDDLEGSLDCHLQTISKIIEH